MYELKITDPPERSKWDWGAVAYAVKKADGDWVKIDPGEPTLVSTVYALKRGNMKDIDPDLYDFTTRDNTTPPSRTCTLYMRFKFGALHPLNKPGHTKRKKD
jgi:hypothetical protein